MSEIKEYSLGFVFHSGKVLLIEKNYPDWQKGKLNGIGGKLEAEETPMRSMIREFREETGFDLTHNWVPRGQIKGNDFLVHLFSNHCGESNYILMTYQESKMPIISNEGEINWHNVDDLADFKTLDNIPLIIPLLFLRNELKYFLEYLSDKPLIHVERK